MTSIKHCRGRETRYIKSRSFITQYFLRHTKSGNLAPSPVGIRNGKIQRIDESIKAKLKNKSKTNNGQPREDKKHPGSAPNRTKPAQQHSVLVTTTSGGLLTLVLKLVSASYHIFVAANGIIVFPSLLYIYIYIDMFSGIVVDFPKYMVIAQTAEAQTVFNSIYINPRRHPCLETVESDMKVYTNLEENKTNGIAMAGDVMQLTTNPRKL